MIWLKRLLKRIGAFISFLSQTARTLSALLTILAALGLSSVVLGYVIRVLPLTITGIAAFIISVLLCISLYTFIEHRLADKSKSGFPEISIYQPPRTAEIEYDVKLLSKEITYQYFPDGQNMRQYKHFKVCALRNGVDSFPDRYRWTGTGKCIVKSLTPGFAVVNERKVEFWDYFDVRFPHPLRVGDKAEFTIEWDLFDEGKTAVPFVSTMIDFDTEHLLMRVLLPREFEPKRAYCYEFENYIDTLPIATQEMEWDPTTQSMDYENPQPMKYHKFVIRWYNS